MLRRKQTMSRHKRENGIVILLVAVFLLFVVGAMAALAIDVVTFYTARSEAQLAADGAALAGARVLANSGLTSTPAGPSAAEDLAREVARQVAASNKVGGKNLTGGPCTGGGEISVCFNDSATTFATNPEVTVKVQRTDLPTFFARIWGNNLFTVSATATAEAYNPSGAGVPPLTGPVTPVAPTCIKPWLLPNISPNNTSLPIFNLPSGTIGDTNLLGWDNLGGTPLLRSRCQNGCGAKPVPGPPPVWRYYPADTTTDFPPPNAASVQCAGSTGFRPYQLSVAGCVQKPIACNGTLTIDFGVYPTRNSETKDAVNCLTHSAASQGDRIDPASVPPQPFQFLAGADNPVVQAGALSAGADIMVSDSLITVPVFDSSIPWPPGGPVTVIGFVQLFLNPDGNAVANVVPYGIKTTIVNLAGCGTGATGQPILGNGASPVPVRLVSPQ
jgi:Flp pilus assembly protein TadG